MFGIFWLLGYQFCPRLANMGDARFWRIDKDAHYGLHLGVTHLRACQEKKHPLIQKNLFFFD